MDNQYIKQLKSPKLEFGTIVVDNSEAMASDLRVGIVTAVLEDMVELTNGSGGLWKVSKSSLEIVGKLDLSIFHKHQVYELTQHNPRYKVG